MNSNYPLLVNLLILENNFLPVKKWHKITSLILLMTKLFFKRENSFECDYVSSFNYISDVSIISGQMQASMKNKLYHVKVNNFIILIVSFIIIWFLK